MRNLWGIAALMTIGCGTRPIEGTAIDPALTSQTDQGHEHRLLNIDFGGPGVTPAAYHGGGVYGIGAHDQWNGVVQGFNSDYTVDHLIFSDGHPSNVSAHMKNLPGSWAASGYRPDSASFMNDYIYSWTGEQATVTLSGLEAGTYLFYVYGKAHGAGNPLSQDSGFSVQVMDGTSQVSTTPVKMTSSSPPGADWAEGDQYVAFADVAVGASQTVQLTISQGDGDEQHDGNNASCLINGLQVVRGKAVCEVVY